MLAAGVDPRDRLTDDIRPRLLEREAEARRTVSRLRAQALRLPADGGNDPVAKKLLADLGAAQKEFVEAWREIANADPLTRVLTDPAFADSALAQVRKAALASGGVLLTYMIGRDQSFAVLSTDPAAPPQVVRLVVVKSVADRIGDPSWGEAVAAAGFRGVVVKPTGKQPERPAAGPAALVPLTDVVTGRLVSQYLQQISDPAFNPTRGIALVSTTRGVSNPSAPEVLGDAVLPPARLAKILRRRGRSGWYSSPTGRCTSSRSRRYYCPRAGCPSTRSKNCRPCATHHRSRRWRWCWAGSGSRPGR